MKPVGYIVPLLTICIGCAKQPSLPADSRFNVTAALNDSAWYGTGRVLRLTEKGQAPGDTREFNLLVFTDIDYPGMSGICPEAETPAIG